MSGGSEVGFCASLRCGVVQSGEGSGVSRRRRIRMIPSPFQAKFFTRCRRRRRSNFEVEEIVREARKEPTDTSAGEKKPSKASIQEGRRTDAKDLFETLEGLKRPRRRHEPKERTDSLSGSDFNILTSLRLQPRTVRSFVAQPIPGAFNLNRRPWKGDPVFPVTELRLTDPERSQKELVDMYIKRPDEDSRIIVIGDVHGCIDELQRLLKVTGYAPGDQVVFLGDLVAKGPASLEVVQLAREINAMACRGNHDHKVICWRVAREKGNAPERTPEEHQSIAESLSEEDLKWMLRNPWFIQYPEMSMIFVHAGLEPGTPLADQRPHMLMNMRSVSTSGKSTTRRGTESWSKHWSGPETVVFGHDASRGIQRHPKAYGLDSGCVHGGWLTALLLPEKRTVSVPARRKYKSMA